MKKIAFILPFAVILTAVTLYVTATAQSKDEIREEILPRDLDSLSNSSCFPIHGIDSTVQAYMKRFHLPGASLAVMRHDSLLYVKGYGWADMENQLRMEPYNVLRVASVSKLITAAGIMKLVEEGKLNLSDKPFVKDGILSGEAYISAIKDRHIYDITIEQLLRHQAGFTAVREDPMFDNNCIKRDSTLTIALSLPLGFKPGTSQEYSNVGYYLLGRIIEKAGGENYQEWMQENILIPAGCHRFHIGGNYEKDRLENEVRYYMHPEAKKCHDISGNGEMVETCYGGNDVTGVEAAGGWVATAPELCRFIAKIDRNICIPDLISEKSVNAMTEYLDSLTFPLGWLDTKDSVWTRTGSFSGTTAIVRYYAGSEECWVFLTNGSTRYGARIAKYSGAMLNEMHEKYSILLPDNDLFY